MNVEDMNGIISSKLKGLRAEKGLSLDEIGKSMNLHRETIRKYENNPMQISVDVLLKFLNLYNKDPLIFFKEVYDKMS